MHSKDAVMRNLTTSWFYAQRLQCLANLRYVVSVGYNTVVVNSSTNFGIVIIKGTAEEKATGFKKTLGNPKAYEFYNPVSFLISFNVFV
jgi:hypothetical protein